MTKAEIKTEQKGLDKRSKRYRDLAKMLAVFDDNQTVTYPPEFKKVKQDYVVIEEATELLPNEELEKRVYSGATSPRTIDGYRNLLQKVVEYAAELRATNTITRLVPTLGRTKNFTKRSVEPEIKRVARYCID